MSDVNEYSSILDGMTQSKTAPAESPRVNEYSDVLDEMNPGDAYARSKAQLDTSAKLADLLPNKGPTVRDLAKHLNLPDAVAMKFFPNTIDQPLTDADWLLHHSPKLSEWAKTPENLNLVTPEAMKPLGSIEERWNMIASNWRNGVGTTNANTAAADIYKRALAGQKFADDPGLKDYVDRYQLGKGTSDYDREVQRWKPQPWDVASQIQDVLNKTAQMLPLQVQSYAAAGETAAKAGLGATALALIAGAATGPADPLFALGAGLTAGTATLPFALLYQFSMGPAGQSYIQYMQQNPQLDQKVALTAASISGALQGMIESDLGFERLIGVNFTKSAAQQLLQSETVRKVILRNAGNMLVSAGQEGLEEILQAVVQAAANPDVAGELVKNRSFEENLDAFLSKMRADPNVQTAPQQAEAAFKGSLIPGIGGGTMNIQKELPAARIAQRQQQAMARAIREAAQAKTAAEDLKAVGDAVKSNDPKTLEVAPLKEMVSDNPNVFVDTNQWDRYWQDQGVTGRDMAEALLGQAETYDEAKRTGEDLKLPSDVYVSKLAGTEHNAFFASELRMAPEQMNAREAVEFSKTVEDAIKGDDTALQVLTERLQGAGFNQDTAEDYASQMAAALNTMSARSGTSVEQLLARYGLSVNRDMGQAPSGALMDQPAYHGSPHAFDEFKLQHIGTGEGAQAYGWGLYFSSKEDVARWYRDNLSSREVSIDGKPVAASSMDVLNNPDDPSLLPLHRLASTDLQPSELVDDLQHLVDAKKRFLEQTIKDRKASGAIKTAASRMHLESLRKQIAQDEASLQWAKENAARLSAKSGGRIYTVDIPDTNDMLDWDKRWSQQSRKVALNLKQALLDAVNDGRIGENNFHDFDIFPKDSSKAALRHALERFEHGVMNHNTTGEYVYGTLQDLLRTDEEGVSRFLAAAGIPGMTYKGDSSGERNFVLFDDSKIKITKMYQTAQSAHAEDAQWAAWKPEVTSTGKIKGAPEWVKNSRDLAKLKREIVQRIAEGAVGRYWYEESARRMLDIVNGNLRDAEKFIQLIAIYSPQANVQVNTYFAVHAWNQWKNGVAREDFKVKTGAQDAKAVGVLYDEQPFDGRKTNSFYLNLMHEIVASQPNALEQLQLDTDLVEALDKPVTVDMWMYRAYGFRNEAAGDDKGSGRYSFVENHVRMLTAQLNQHLAPGEDRWTPHQVQAAVWSAMKARYEIAAVKEATWAESIKKGLAWEDADGRHVPTEAEKLRQHREIWRKHAMRVSPEVATAEAQRTSASFKDFLSQMTETVTWEAIPSTALGHAINKANEATKALFNDQARRLLLDEFGHDLLAAQLGVPLSSQQVGLGGYDGAVSPNVLSSLVPTKRAGEFSRDEVRAYAQAIQYIFKQDAVPWIRPEARALSKAAQADQQFRVVKNGRTVKRFPTLVEAHAFAEMKGGEVRGGPYARGITLTFGDNVEPDKGQALLEALNRIGIDGFTRTAPNQVLVVNFRDDATGVPFTDDEEFIDKVSEFLSGNAGQLGVTSAARIWLEGEYGNVHDWQADRQGSQILDSGSLAGRSDLHAWLRDRRALFEALLSDFENPAVAEADGQVTEILNQGAAPPTAPISYLQQIANETVREITVPVDRVKSAEDAAAVVADFGRAAQENMLAIVVGAGGKILEVQRHTIGAVDSASVSPALYAGAALSVKGVKEVWFAHNHPSGTTVHSQADKMLTGRLIDTYFKDTGVKSRGMLVVSSAGKASYSERGDVDLDIKPTQTESKTKVKVTERMIQSRAELGLSVGSPSQIADFVRRAGHQQGLVLFNNQLQPVGFMALDEKQMANVRDGKGKSIKTQVLKALHETNANRAAIVMGEAPDLAAAQNMATFVRSLQQIDLVDVLDRNGNSYRDQIKESYGRYQQEKRGYIAISPTRQLSITLLEKADLSTFLHESGHAYLEIFHDLVKQIRDQAEYTPTQSQMLQDADTLAAWMGINSLDEMTVEHKEQFARGYEAYTMEGKAPSVGLRRAFARFRTWLLALYRSIRNLNVSLNDEVRSVFDRMLATDEEIEVAKRELSMPALFNDAISAGMSEREWAAYQQKVEDANRTATEELERKVMAQLLRERQAWWKEESAKVAADVSAELAKDRDYAARSILRNGTTPTGEEVPPVKLNRGEVYGLYEAPAIRKALRGMLADDGLTLADAATTLGFGSGDELIDSLLKERKPFRQAVADETQRRMLATHGDMLNDGSLAEAAKAAVANEYREEVIQAELQALAALERQTRGVVQARAADARQAQRQGAAMLRAVPPLGVFRQIAEGRLTQSQVKDVLPGQWLAAARKASKAAMQAILAQDYPTAAIEKQRELLNIELYRQASQLRDELDKQVKYLRSFQQGTKRESVGKSGFLDQIDALLERVDLAPRSLREITKRAALKEWLADQIDAGVPVDPDLLEYANAVPAKNWRLLTVEELSGIVDGVRHIEHLSKLKNRLLKAKQEAEIAIVAAEVEDTVRKTADPRPKQLETETPEARRRKGWGDLLAIMRKVSSLARQMDGGDNGVFWRNFVRPLQEAATQEAMLTDEYAQKLAAIMAPYLGFKQRMQTRAQVMSLGAYKGGFFRPVFIPEIQASLSKAGQLMVALNVGSESNRQRLMDSYGWDETQVAAVLKHLSKQDWDTVQAIWNLIDELRPESFALDKRITGVEPQRVMPKPVITDFGTYKGGYFPVKWNRDIGIRGGELEAVDAAQQAMRGAATRSTTKQGHLKARFEGKVDADLKLRLDFGVVYQHLGEVIHDITHREAVIDANRLLRDRRIRRAMVDYYGRPVYDQYQSMVNDVAAGNLPSAGPAGKMMSWVRGGISIAAMGFNLSTALLQPIGLTQSMVRIGPKWVAKGLLRWAYHPAAINGIADFIYSRSELMQTRDRTMLREINEIRNSLEGRTKFADAAFYLIGKMQKIADIPTWLGAYEKAYALDPKMDEATAVALADQAVVDAQAGGQLVNLARVQRGNEFEKLFTNFYSIFSATYNLTVESARAVKSVRDVPRFAVDMLLLYAVPAVLSQMVFDAFRGSSDDDPETRYLKAILAYYVNTIPYAREVAGVIQGYDYTGPAGTRVFSELGKLIKQTEQGDADAAWWRALNNTSGILLHYPATQVQRTVEGLVEYSQHPSKTSPLVVVTGPERRK